MCDNSHLPHCTLEGASGAFSWCRWRWEAHFSLCTPSAHYCYPGAQHSDLHENFSRDFIHLTPWPRAPWRHITMWTVEQISQLFRNWFWFFQGRTCQERHSMCSQGLSSIATPGGRSRGETGSLHSQQAPSCRLGGKLASVTPFLFFRTSRIIAQYPMHAQQVVDTQGLKNLVQIFSALLVAL